MLPNDAKLVEDYKGNQLLLFASQWSIQWVQDRNKGCLLYTSPAVLAVPACHVGLLLLPLL